MRSKKRVFSFGSRTFILTAAIIVILGGVISGTVAWMFIKSDPVHNTFTYGDMAVELTETETGLDGDEDENTNSYSLNPGAKIAKDPVVKVMSGTVGCWVFVEVNKSEKFDEYMSYEMADGWAKLEEGVYYRQMTESEETQQIPVLKGNTVTVNDSVTQVQLDDMTEDDYPSIEFTAYAVQISGDLDANKAWKVAKGK